MPLLGCAGALSAPRVLILERALSSLCLSLNATACSSAKLASAVKAPGQNVGAVVFLCLWRGRGEGRLCVCVCLWLCVCVRETSLCVCVFVIMCVRARERVLHFTTLVLHVFNFFMFKFERNIFEKITSQAFYNARFVYTPIIDTCTKQLLWAHW